MTLTFDGPTELGLATATAQVVPLPTALRDVVLGPAAAADLLLGLAAAPSTKPARPACSNPPSDARVSTGSDPGGR